MGDRVRQAKLFATSALGLFMWGCSASPPPSSKAVSSSAPTAIACGDPTPVVKLGSGYAAPAGPLLFAGRFRGGRAEITDFKPGPYKVPIHPQTALEAPVTMQGWRCSDGHPLRFWYKDRGDPFWEIQHESLETVGDLIATLEPAGVSASDQVVDPLGEVHTRLGGIRIGYGGYILFTSPGTWKVSVLQQGHVLGSVVFLVTEG